MAYFYQVSFNIGADDMTELEIGSSLERVIGYLKTLLPSQPGYIDARALYSLDSADPIYVVVHSLWDRWDDLEQHRASNLAEEKVLREFGPHIEPEDLIVQIFNEVS
jgi:heme-degrading monooxygenase HmoA